jgi:streptogramin lyase
MKSALPLTAVYAAGVLLAACGGPSLSALQEPQLPLIRHLAGSQALDDPIGLAEDKAGNLYVADAGSSQILVYDSKNEQVPSKTITDGVDQPADLTFDGAGNLYASERSSNEVTVYNSSGKLVKTLHTDKSSGFSPSGVGIASTGDVWVANRNGTNYDVGELQVFNSSGKVIHSSTKELEYPIGIVFEGSDTWVFDSETASITVFDSNANVVTSISLSGVSPHYAAKDRAGDLYVTDASASLIAILNSSGKVLKTMQSKGLDGPNGIVFNSAGDFFVANENNNTITEYDSKGNLIHTIE